MAQYTKQVSGDAVRYKDGGKFVKAEDVTDAAKKTLESAPEGTVVDELGDVVDPSTETDEGSGDDETVPTAPQTPPEDESDADEEDSEEEADDEDDEEEAPAPRARRSRKEIGGMGYPAKNGKTLSIFSDKPHETVKNVGGHMVPLTLEELNGDPAKGVEPKTDTEIIEKLKKLGKI